MKRFLIISAAVLCFIFLVLFLSTSSEKKRGPYFNEDYYKNTIARLDKINPPRVVLNGPVHAGFSKVSITPVLNSAEDDHTAGKFVQLPLAGYGARSGAAATGIHDSVFVKAVALKVGSQTIVFVGADLLIMPPNITDAVTARLAEIDLRREQVFYSATHTHSSVGAWASGFIGELFSGEENINVEKWLVHQVSKAIMEAIADLRPAQIGTGNFTIDAYTSNRLIGGSGTKNNDFSFITLEQTGHKKAVIGSYSAHATTLGPDNLEISGDYPGYWAKKMEETSVDYALFFAGSVGSQSPAGAIGKGFEKPKYIGEALADSLDRRLSQTALSSTTTFSTILLKMELPEYHIRLTTTINLTTALSNWLLPLSENAYLQSVRIGNMVWVSTPSDFSGEYALQLKNSLASYGFNANVTSFNGNYCGYIVPGRYFYLDKYEPQLMGWFGPNMGEYTMDLVRQLSRAMTGLDNI